MLLHPGGYGLTDKAELASNLRLVLASLPEPNGLKATFLQGIKIASYSGRVFHARLDAANPEKYLYIMRDSIIAPMFRHRRLVVVYFAGIFLGSGLATFLLPRQYEAEMKILIRRERVDPVVTADKTALVESHPEVSEEQLQSEVELLKSRDLLEQVVRTCRLDSIGEQATAEGTDAQAGLARAVGALQNTLEAASIK